MRPRHSTLRLLLVAVAIAALAVWFDYAVCRATGATALACTFLH